MSVIGRLIVNARVQPFVIVVVKIVGDAGLGVGQVDKNGPLADFQDLRFEARPQTFRLGIIVESPRRLCERTAPWSWSDLR